LGQKNHASGDVEGQQKYRWEDIMQQDPKLFKLKKEDTGNRDKWRRRITALGVIAFW
jgi:hypothetical protein